MAALQRTKSHLPDLRALAKELVSHSPSHKWDGTRSVLEMHAAHYSKCFQTEWQGWYLEYLAASSTSLAGFLDVTPLRMPCGGSRHATFDATDKSGNPWDLKTHCGRDRILLNDATAIDNAIGTYGSVNFLILSGDLNRTEEFSDWHRTWRHDNNPSKRRRSISKTKFSRKLAEAMFLNRLLVVELDATSLPFLDVFQEGYKNSNSRPRAAKYALSHSLLTSSSPLRHAWIDLP